MNTKTTTVTGRNGFDYDGTKINDDLFIVGKFICKVEQFRVVDTVCRATKANIKRFSK
jgi:hypothetical protein